MYEAIYWVNDEILKKNYTDLTYHDCEKKLALASGNLSRMIIAFIDELGSISESSMKHLFWRPEMNNSFCHQNILLEALRTTLAATSQTPEEILNIITPLLYDKYPTLRLALVGLPSWFADSRDLLPAQLWDLIRRVFCPRSFIPPQIAD